MNSRRLAKLLWPPGRGSRTAQLLQQLGVEIFHLAEGIEKARDAIIASNTVVFATPTRWFNVSASMKDLIDSLPEAPTFPCHGKTAFFLAVCEEDGAQQAINQMMAPLNHMGFKIPPYASYIYNVNMAEKSEDQWQAKGMAHLRRRLRS
jgi:multimeric flavodoxin WrbA